MRKEIIFTVAAGICGAAIGYFIGKITTERRIEKELEEPRIARLYPENPVEEPVKTEKTEKDVAKETFTEIAEEEGYIPNESDEELQEQEAIEASEKFNSYIQKHSQEIFIISPDSEKRPDDLNNALNMVDTEMLLYFPDEDVLTSEEGARLEIEDYVGDQLMKYGFAIDPRQTEIQVFNVPYQMRYIVRKETENSVDELFPE